MLLSGVPPRPEADVPPLLHIIRELGVDLNAPSFSTAAAIRHALSGNTPVR